MENNTEAYIRSVCAQTGWRRDEVLNLEDKRQLAAFVRAVVRHEQGMQPFQDEEILAAVEDALR